MRPFRSFLTSLVVLTGFFTLAQSGSTVVDSIKVSGVYRKFRLYIPSNYTGNQKVPLVLNLHGLSSNALQQQYYSNFMPLADTAGFLVIHPDGSLNGTTQYWNAGLFQNTNDLDFLGQLIDSVSAGYQVNSDRVYMCGMSNGGIMSYYFNCQRPGKIAAMASVAGTMFRTWFFDCAPPLALPVMEIHGTGDGIVPYAGNASGSDPGAYLAIDSVIDKWVSRNACAAASITAIPDISASDGSTATNYRYLNGLDGCNVELIKVSGGSHSWPGAINVIAGTNQDFSASAEIWRFFRQFQKKQFVQPASVSEQLQQPNILAPNPAKDRLYFGNASGKYEILDLSGKVMIKGDMSEPALLTELPPGLYMVKIQTEKGKGYSKLVVE